MSKDNRIYLDNAATTKISPEVLSEMLPAFGLLFGNASSMYEEGRKSKAVLEEARRNIADILEAKPEEIFFTGSGTEADNWAVKGIAFRHQNKGKHIITTQIEHPAVLESCAYLEKEGFEITYLPVDKEGLITPEEVFSAIRPDTILVSVMTANNEIGTILPIKEIAEVCKGKRILFHTDAVQAVGSVPVSVKDLGVDLLSLSAHKFHGPKGIGVLYIKTGTAISPFMNGGRQERGKRAGTENLPGAIGLSAALSLAVKNIEENALFLQDIRDTLIDEIEKSIPLCTLNGAREKRLPGNVNFSFSFVEGESLLLLLDRDGYACSSGSACTSGSLEPSHVLLSIGLSRELAQGSLRISIGKYNTKEEVLSLVPILQKRIERLRQMMPRYVD